MRPIYRFLQVFLAAALAIAVATPQVHAQAGAFETKAKQIYLIEARTGTVLYARNENDLIPPASLAKLMTAEYVFNELKSGRITEATEYKVSEYAWRTGGALSRTSTMFAALNSKIRVIDLLQGMIVHSANDACIILAEGLAGTEQAFAAKLTERARALGLAKSEFYNSNGLPDPKNKTSLRDMALLARHLQATYPEYYKLYAQPDFEWNKIRQRNRNPLIGFNIGADGLATGFAEQSGYAIVGSVARNGTRLILAMGGLKSEKERAEEARRVFEWAFSSFASHKVFAKDEVIAEAAVFGGATGGVPLKAATDVDIFVPVDNPDRIRARIAYKWPLVAPVKAGQQIGTLTISVGERTVRSLPVFAGADVGTGTLTSKAYDGLKELLFFWL